VRKYFLLKFVYLCQRVRNPAGKNFLVFQDFHHLLNCKVPCSSLCCHFRDCYASVPSDELNNSSFFLPAEKVHGQPSWGWLAISVFPCLKCFMHCLTLLASMQSSPYACWSFVWMCNGGISSLTKYLSLHIAKTTCLCQPLSCTEIWPCDRDRQCDFCSGVTG
jgi:hypothetical protein